MQTDVAKCPAPPTPSGPGGQKAGEPPRGSAEALRNPGAALRPQQPPWQLCVGCREGCGRKNAQTHLGMECVLQEAKLAALASKRWEHQPREQCVQTEAPEACGPGPSQSPGAGARDHPEGDGRGCSEHGEP